MVIVMSGKLQRGLLICLTLSLGGCGGGAPDLPKTVPVSGKVTLNGVPCPAGATVMLIPVAGGRPSTGTTDSAGAFVLSTFGEKDGAVPGEHYVGVTLAEATGGPAAPVDEYNTGTVEGAQPKVKWIVPEKFSNPEQSGVQVTIPAEGSSNLEIPLGS